MARHGAGLGYGAGPQGFPGVASPAAVSHPRGSWPSGWRSYRLAWVRLFRSQPRSRDHWVTVARQLVSHRCRRQGSASLAPSSRTEPCAYLAGCCDRDLTEGYLVNNKRHEIPDVPPVAVSLAWSLGRLPTAL